MIEVNGLIKTYGKHNAVNNLSFKIPDNCVFGFLGPNGAGKSTTMNMITGCLSPTEGQILINGRDILTEPEDAKKYIGYLPEIPPVYEDLTPYEYLLFVGEAKKIPKSQIKSEIDRVMELTNISHMKNRLIKNLSKGYRQRVGISQAILGNPPIIILDEPTVGLDPEQIIDIRNLIKELGKNHTVILSSHILSEISAVCGLVMIISKGSLVSFDTIENLSGGTLEKSVLMEAKGDKNKIENALKSIDGVNNFGISDKLGFYQFSFDAENDPREKVFYAMSEISCPIMSMSLKKSSLEDIFLNLVQENYDYEKGGVK